MAHASHTARVAECHVTRITRLDNDRAVAVVEAGQFTFGSVFIVGLADHRPVVSWPRTARGYPIICVAEPLKSTLEGAILAAVAESVRGGYQL